MPLRDILNDLYRADTSLKAREQELIKLIETLMKAKPNAPIDDKFKAQLRASVQKKSVEPQARPMPRMLLWVAPAALFVVAAGVMVAKYLPETSPGASTDVTVASGPATAFGSLSAVTFDRNRAGGGTEQAPATAGDMSIKPYPAPDFTYTRYAYDGTITIPNLPVLRRDARFTDSLDAVLSNATIAGLDLKKFSKLDIDQLTISEQGDNGIVIHIDRQNGQISLSRAAASEPAVSLERPSGTPSALPADAELIAAAQRFLSTYGISTSGLGDPVVRKDWVVAAALSAERSYVPTEVSVVFPWKVNGQYVYDEGGHVYGLTVNVGANLTVMSASNIVPLTFTASSYPLTTDTALVQSTLRRGGIWYAEPPQDAKTQTVTVGAPTAGYSLSRLLVDGRSRDVLVPSLIFAVNAADYAKAGRTSVVIPVADELLKLAPSDAASSGSAGSIEPARASDLPAEATKE